jgi:hypothetical protein
MGRLTIDKLLRTRYIKVVVRHGDKRNLVTEKEESPVMKFGLAVSFDSIMGPFIHLLPSNAPIPGYLWG